jgi:nitrogen-specific signal transduction histidine kinase
VVDLPPNQLGLGRARKAGETGADRLGRQVEPSPLRVVLPLANMTQHVTVSSQATQVDTAASANSDAVTLNQEMMAGLAGIAGVSRGGERHVPRRAAQRAECVRVDQSARTAPHSRGVFRRAVRP